MKNISTSLFGIAYSNVYDRLTKEKEYPVFKITHPSTGTRVTILTDKGTLESWSSDYFKFITKS